jgi:hypothetical protein
MLNDINSGRRVKMTRQTSIEILTFEEAADILKLELETVKDAVEKGFIKAKSLYELPGHALSLWWQSRGGKTGIFLDDYLDDIPSLPVIYARAVDIFESKASARSWLFDAIPALGYKSPVEFAKENPQGVIDLLDRIEYGGLS